MKEGWSTTTLGEKCEIYQPKTISAKDMIQNGRYPVYGANGVIGRYNEFNHADPQLLITCRGATCGSVNVSEPKSWITGNAMVVRPKNGEIDLRFLEYVFRGGIDISRAITGAAQPQITRTNLAPLEITYPRSVEEQRRIVGALDRAFAAIAIAKANTEKNLQNAQALLETSRERAFTHRNSGWVRKNFADLCEISSALVDPRRKGYLEMLHVGGANIKSKTGELFDLRTSQEEGLISGKFAFDENAVLYSKIRPYLMKVARPGFEGLCSADIYPLSPKKGHLDRDFLFHLLLTPQFTAYAVQGSARAGIPKVNRDHLFAYQCEVPSAQEQKRLAELLDEIFDESQRLENLCSRKLEDLKELRGSFLHKAFSGTL